MSFIVYGTVNFKILYVKNASVLFTHEITLLLYSVEIMCLHVIAVNLKFNFH